MRVFINWFFSFNVKLKFSSPLKEKTCCVKHVKITSTFKLTKIFIWLHLWLKIERHGVRLILIFWSNKSLYLNHYWKVKLIFSLFISLTMIQRSHQYQFLAYFTSEWALSKPGKFYYSFHQKASLYLSSVLLKIKLILILLSCLNFCLQQVGFWLATKLLL